MDEVIKKHKSLFEIIDEFVKPKTGVLVSSLNALNGEKANFIYSDAESQIKFENEELFPGRGMDLGYTTDIQAVEFENATYFFDKIFIGSFSPPVFTAKLDQLYTIGFSKTESFFYQLVIPLKKKPNNNYSIEEICFKTDLGLFSREGVKTEVDGVVLEMLFFQRKKTEYFLIIESNSKQSFDSFAEKVGAAIISFAFLTGSYFGDQGFYFSKNLKDQEVPNSFLWSKLRHSFQSSFTPIYSNVYAYLGSDKDLITKYVNKLRPASYDEFSILCTKVFSSLELSSAIMLILESSVASLVFRPGGYAIALENLSSLIKDPVKPQDRPINDELLSEKLEGEMQDVLENYKDIIGEEEYSVLSSRIKSLNNITNWSRLKAPFEYLNISLFEEDLEVLKTRNDFLHGRIPKLGNGKSLNKINSDLLYISLRLYTLLNILILKWIGYDNYVVNYPKVFSVNTQRAIEEEYYRKV